MNQQIEIEKKVKLEPYHIKQIEKKGILIKEFQFKDTYFDKKDFHLTSQNIWLRQRESRFELKVGIKDSNRSVDRYEEILDEQRILDRLHLTMNHSENLSNILFHAKILPFATFTTQRRRYQLEGIFIDIDIADFGDLIYCVAEFELLVSESSEIKEAEKKIENLLRQMKINLSRIIPGKLIYYLYHKHKKHYKTLVDCRVIIPIYSESLTSSLENK